MPSHAMGITPENGSEFIVKWKRSGDSRLTPIKDLLMPGGIWKT